MRGFKVQRSWTLIEKDAKAVSFDAGLTLITLVLISSHRGAD